MTFEGHRDFGKIVNPCGVGGFTAQKKPVG